LRLEHACELPRANAGAPGVDGLTFAAIEAAGLGADTLFLLGARRFLPRSVFLGHADKHNTTF
jgi:hypothetical protein